ncbi:MerR family transcriptional regulator [Streptomyces sp. J2-1]|uniref:MerR family transcriptional regulator n=1 Tax=Streptomyces corallincola TaxID=2851888 RepID=UPI001C38EE02|nr:MerR family transcriptional regulator [Streptomyces corallincola]MBV2355456.1 MerR family transcriptional regulator [Streptomyces corallincola]
MDDARCRPLRTADVARQSGYSPQQVRDLERLGVVPPATRAGNGYRAYTALHVRALHAYRGLARAAGPVEARRVLAGLRGAGIGDAAAAVGAVHVRLAAERDEVLHARRALAAIRAECEGGGAAREGDDGAREGDSMTITELAGALGVRPSALRFWEREGLVAPERVTTLRARRYGPAAVGAARIVVALRGAGYGVPAVREIMGALGRYEGLEETERVLGVRLDAIADRTVALLRAGSDLAAVISEAEVLLQGDQLATGFVRDPADGEGGERAPG